MTAPLKLANGTVTAPALAFSSATGTGIYKTTNGWGVAIGGVLISEFTSSGFFSQRLVITGAANNGAGLIRLTLADTSMLATGQIKTVTGVGGTTEANGTWLITVVDATHVDLQDSTFTNVYVSGGYIGNGAQDIIIGSGLDFSAGAVSVAPTPLPRGYIDGCTISNGTDTINDINIAAGACRDSTNAFNITVAAMAGKQLDSNWAPGAAAGMRNSAAGIANTTYHIYAVAKADGTQDIYAHTSAVVATALASLQLEAGGANYIYARRIASIRRLSNTIVPFSQIGDEFLLKTVIRSVSDLNSGTAQVLRTLDVPTGIRVMAQINVAIGRGTSGGFFALLVTSPDQTNSVPSSSLYTLQCDTTADVNPKFSTFMTVRTSTLGQIGTRQSASDINSLVEIMTHGWIDTRGRDA